MTPDDSKPAAGASQNERNGHLPATRSSSRLSTKPPLQVDTEAAQNLNSNSPLTSDADQSLNPSKKRKLNGPVSPPWKSAAAQTPSSFIDDSGRKRSMRMMAPPPTPVTPAKDGRRTRANSTTAAKHTPDTDSARSKIKQPRPGTRTSPRSKQQTPSLASKSPSTKHHPRANGKPGPSASSRSPATAKPIHTRTPVTSPAQKKLGRRKSQDAHSAASSVPRRRSARHGTISAAELNDDAEAGEEDDADAAMRDAPENLDEDDYDSSKRISWRLKFSRKVKPPLFCNIGNMALPRKHASLRAFFEAEDNDPEYLKQTQDAAELEAARRTKLEEAYEAGLLRPENLQAPSRTAATAVGPP
ncbi:hypothetical protein DRE_05152 [Drechslerella stenobrocha 248]|uniref:Uncharacterized protein n=1 Tax=Drechslerella stenobrocha 248 TaxID=1043628 RepID=W7I9T5_9PEZI|nr:hypothetical protein DRE_05152 [Drechslerella stenobrocha 248]